MEYFLSNDGIFIPFTRNKNELYPHFLKRVKITLDEINNLNNINFTSEIQKKLNKNRYKVTYISSDIN